MRRPFSPDTVPRPVLLPFPRRAAGPAASEPEGTKKTLYGMFRQSAEGGINFIDPRNPTSSTFRSMPKPYERRPEHQGAGARRVVESFSRNGKNYRLITVDSVKPMTAEYGATTIAPGQHPGLPAPMPPRCTLPQQDLLPLRPLRHPRAPRPLFRRPQPARAGPQRRRQPGRGL